ncbi:hypothetical protein DFH07DRAFT_775950 [Mycena maculata]|uniref:Uncharacterized protein n=1 Tax=Mycena maculata TaxID=230809 RepID=A0AAD7IRW0_9AGAR|nr:hypothetical protein DFH07DRAFT_775950 [Mycena maculata]
MDPTDQFILECRDGEDNVVKVLVQHKKRIIFSVTLNSFGAKYFWKLLLFPFDSDGYQSADYFGSDLYGTLVSKAIVKIIVKIQTENILVTMKIKDKAAYDFNEHHGISEGKIVEDWDYEYRYARNRFGYLGNGFTQREIDSRG